METTKNYIEINKHSWNNRVDAHFHPVVWMFDDDFEKIGYHYFNVAPIAETENGTYADKAADRSQPYVTWNHSLSEVVGSLLNHGMEMLDFREYDYSPYNIFSNMIEFETKKYRIGHLGNKIPMVYAVVAKKKHPRTSQTCQNQ